MRNARRIKPVVASTKPEPSVSPSPLGSTARRAESLHPATPLEVRLARALDQELSWFFEFAEAQLQHDNVGILPNYALARMLAEGDEPSDEAVRMRGHELARRVCGCVHSLPPRHGSVLRAAYTPRRWPTRIEEVFDMLTPIVVRLTLAEEPWPPRLSGRKGLECAAASRLSAALHEPTKVKVGKLKVEAQRLLGKAVAAYAESRAGALIATLGAR
jgi:hypothetical protein